MKRFLTLIALIITSTGLLLVHADMKGSCGKDLRWTLDDNGTLVITGQGPMGHIQDHHFRGVGTLSKEWYCQKG